MNKIQKILEKLNNHINISESEFDGFIDNLSKKPVSLIGKYTGKIFGKWIKSTGDGNPDISSTHIYFNGFIDGLLEEIESKNVPEILKKGLDDAIRRSF